MSSSLVHAFRFAPRNPGCSLKSREIPASVARQLILDADALDDLADGAGVDAVIADLHFVFAGQGILDAGGSHEGYCGVASSAI